MSITSAHYCFLFPRFFFLLILALQCVDLEFLPALTPLVRPTQLHLLFFPFFLFLFKLFLLPLYYFFV